MILEVTQIDIKPGCASAFETSIEKAVCLLRQVQGFCSYELLRSIEVQDRYRLLVRWESIASHTTGFQKSALFQEWRALLGGYFENTPSVEHMEFLLGAATNAARSDLRRGKSHA